MCSCMAVRFGPPPYPLTYGFAYMPSSSIDLETRSTVDLRRTGVHPYASHPDTSVICACWAIGDEEPNVWLPGQPIPERLRLHVESGAECRAHNCSFERVLIRDLLGPRYGFPVPTLEQWHDTAAEAAAMALPRHLAGLSRVLRVEHEKDDAGHRLMLQMCRPRKTNPDGSVIWWDEEDPDKLCRLIEYCRQDVRAERACAARLRRLGPTERAVYLLDQRINDRGVLLDVPLIEAASAIVDVETAKANAELREITDGQVTTVSKVADLASFAGLPDVQKATVRDALDGDGLDPDVRRALQLRAEVGKSSAAKLKTMQVCKGEDNRARGLLLYHGASTGRWSGKLIQPQNFPRPEIGCADYCDGKPCICGGVERFIPGILSYVQDSTYWEHLDWTDPPMTVVTSLLRSMLIASPGHRFLAGDYSQIEARVLGWLAGEPYGDREYERMAAAIYGVPLSEVTPEQRQVGKMTILGAGFQMGAARYQEQVQTVTGIVLPDDLAVRAIDTYRMEKAGIKQYWYGIEDGAMEAVREPGKVVHIGPLGNVRYVVRGQFLWCILPSGRPLAYALPSLRMRTVKWTDIKGEEHSSRKLGLQYMGVGFNRKWGVQHAYGGLLTENVVQATARDLMALAMLRLEEAGYPVILTVHDEVVAEVPRDRGSLGHFLDLMRQTPAWCADLSVEVEGWEHERLRK